MKMGFLTEALQSGCHGGLIKKARLRFLKSGHLGEPARLCTSVYLGCLGFGLPLIMHNAYFDITETKEAFYLLLSLAYLGGLAVIRLGSSHVKKGEGSRNLRMPLICLAIFVGSHLVSAAVNGTLLKGMIAPDNRYQGWLTAMVYGGVLFCIARHLYFPRWCRMLWVAGYCGVCLLGVCNGFLLDPLGVYEKIAPGDASRYVSTLGNLNFYGGYLALLTPMVMWWWCTEADVRVRWFLGAGLVLGAAGMTAASESCALGMMGATVLFPFLLGNKMEMKRFLLACLMTAGVWAGYRISMLLLPTRFYLPLFIRIGTQPLVWALWVMLLGGALCLMNKREGNQPGWKRGYAFALAGAVGVMALAVLAANTILKDRPLGPLERVIRFNGQWGTDRGKIWAYCGEIFGTFSPIQKLLGGGPGILNQMDGLHPLFLDAALDSAHNEYLQYLLTLGLVGLGAYLGLLGTLFLRAWRRGGGTALNRAFLLGGVSYAAQAFVNIAQPASTPLFFGVLGMLAGSLLSSDTAEGTDKESGPAPLDKPALGKF